MVLVDTSVWIHHFRRGDSRLQSLLEEGLVLSHPFVIGELACGNLKNRREILTDLLELPESEVSDFDEVLALVDSEGLYGKGIGWIDAHLLASARLSGSELWTLDRPLATAAKRLGIAARLHVPAST